MPYWAVAAMSAMVSTHDSRPTDSTGRQQKATQPGRCSTISGRVGYPSIASPRAKSSAPSRCGVSGSDDRKLCSASAALHLILQGDLSKLHAQVELADGA